MIQIDPNEPTNYFALSKHLRGRRPVRRGRTGPPEGDATPSRTIPIVYTTLSGFYNRQGDFDKTMETLNKAAELDPKNPQGYQLIATYYWEKVHKDHRLTPPQKKDYALKGIDADDKALALNPDYFDALIFKNILLRLQGNAETDPATQKKLIQEADELRTKAMAIQKGAKAAAAAPAPKSK